LYIQQQATEMKLLLQNNILTLKVCARKKTAGQHIHRSPNITRLSKNKGEYQLTTNVNFYQPYKTWNT